jgi:hypothetical protein
MAQKRLPDKEKIAKIHHSLGGTTEVTAAPKLPLRQTGHAQETVVTNQALKS